MAATQETAIDKYKKVKRIKWLVRLLGGSTGVIIAAAITIFLIVSMAILGGESSTGTPNGGISGNASVQNLPPEVMRWQAMVEQECAAQECTRASSICTSNYYGREQWYFRKTT
ncbi:hypothetical protein AAHB65_02400 [Bacillus toyonensis]